MLTSDPLDAQVHVAPLATIQVIKLKDYLDSLRPHFTQIYGFRPTGWTFSAEAGTDKVSPTISAVLERDRVKTYHASYMRPMRGSTSVVSAYGVPYSEHSSFFE